MMELIYPFDLAPLVPQPTAETMSNRDPFAEYLPVVEPNGMVTGRSTRDYCHFGVKPLHPVVHLHVVDRFSRIYLQKRPMTKTIQPGKWDTAVGGHVTYGETLLEALFRETSEEIGLREFHPVFLKDYVFESEVERELVNIFAAVGSFDLKPDPDELDEGRWWTLEEIDANLGEGIFTPNFESEFDMIRQSLLALL